MRISKFQYILWDDCVIRYKPVTGEALLRQEFAPKYVNSIGQTISNTVRAKGADITADETGRVFVTGGAAGQMPITLADNYSGVTGFNPYPDVSYMGGAYLLVMSEDLSRWSWKKGIMVFR